MRSRDFLYETIDIICEKTTADELIPYLEPLGFDVQKKTGTTVKVIVPAMYRLSSVKQIADILPGSVISDNGKEVHYDGSKILVKPSEAQGARLEKEEGQIIAIDSAIKEHLKGKPFIKLMVGTKIVNAAGASKVSGNVKADAQILDQDGNPVAWLSLKDGTTVRGFGQWGGVNYLGSDPEVAKFVNNLIKAFPEGISRTGTWGVPIKSDYLKSLTVFGKDFGKESGINNVDLVLQGHPTLTKGTRGSFVLTGAHTWHNGDIPTGEYEPVLMVRFAGDRSDFGIKNARITSYPSGGRPWRPIPKPVKSAAAQLPTPQPKKPALKASQPTIGAEPVASAAKNAVRPAAGTTPTV